MQLRAPLVVLALFLALRLTLPAAAQESAPQEAQVSDDFSRAVAGALPRGYLTRRLNGDGAAPFRIVALQGGSAVVETSGLPLDVLYYEAATSEPLEMSYTFVYTGPHSVVEPFLVNARPGAGPGDGWTVDLGASAPGNNSAGQEAYQYRDASSRRIVKKIFGRLRSEPYFYRSGRTYRVDVVADSVSGVLSTRVYDAAIGPPAFDRSVLGFAHRFEVYPGVLNRLGGAVAITSFSFGRYGAMPPRAHIARRAFDYLDYLGYNAAVNGPPTTPMSLAFQKYFPALLIRHVRIPADGGRFAPALNAVSRFGIDADVLTSNKTTLASLKAFIAGLTLRPDSIELWNEPNNASQGAAHDPNYELDLPPFAQTVEQAFPRIPLWGPSVLPDANGYPTAAQKLAAAVGPYVAAWNGHPYAQDTPENLGYGGFISGACGETQREDCGWYGATNWNDNESAVLSPARPGITTEGAASYGSYPAICGHTNVSLGTQQAYLQRGMLYDFKLGHLRIYPYKFVDDGKCSDGFGSYGILSRVVAGDGSLTFAPKPAYTALVYLDRLLCDGGRDAATFVPKPLSYAVSGLSPDVEELLLAESDGSYRLVFWSDARLWDFNANGPHAAGAEVPLVSRPLTLRLPEPMTVAVFTQTPLSGQWTQSALHPNANSIALTVDQYPLVVALARGASGQALVPVLPREVPTPGPTETPGPRS